MNDAYEPALQATGINPRQVKPDGVLRMMRETGHCPLRDYDYVNIAKAFGIGPGDFRAIIRKHALDAQLEDESMGRSKKIDDQKALELYRKGMLDLEIAKEFGCTNSAVTAWRATHNLPSNARGKKAPQEPTACKHENDVPSCDVCPDAPCNGLADEQAAMEAMADKLAGRKAAKVNPEWEKAVDEMVASNKPVIQPPTVEELLDVIDLLKRQRLVLIGIAIGAGVQDVWKQLEEALA